MMSKNKILAVSFIAMFAVSSAHATVVTQSNIVGANGVSVTVPDSGDNKGKVQVSGPDLSGKENVLTFTTSGSGNVVTGVSKSGSTVTLTKGSTLNNKTLTIKQGGSNTQTFTANSATDVTVDITAAKVGAVASTQTTKGGILTTNASNGAVEVSTTIAGTKVAAATNNARGTVQLASGSTNTTAENEANKLLSTTARDADMLQRNDLYPSVATTQNMITTVTGALTTSVNSKIDKRVAADKDSVMVRDNAGNYVKGTSSDITVATSNGTTTVTVNHATKATQDASGNVITDTYATKSELSTTNTNKQDKSTAVTHTANTAAGDASTPVYVTTGGVATAITKGTIANNDTAGQGAGLVTGKTVYTEVRPTATNNTTSKGYLASATAATNLTNLDTAIKTIHPNTGEVKIPSGSETSTTLASIWVE